jgi:hypothetical protein
LTVFDRPAAVLFAMRLGIAQLLIWVQAHSMEYRGIRYTIRARIERERWSVAIHPAGIELAEKVISGPREIAELRAHSMINKWLEKCSTKKY